jgi:hypothetical protein
MKVICPYAKKCRDTGCPHRVEHEKDFECDGPCIEHPKMGPPCVPVNSGGETK